jgi:hypothetical protein
MRTLLQVVIAVVSSVLITTQGLEAGSGMSSSSPVLVELFTSEGCSSCPPADAFLQKLDQQTVPGTQVIVLSEHVDYWNHIGWKDPYSSSFYSQRQNAYGSRFNLGDVYTPQMVVDGVAQFAGSDQVLANAAISKAASNPKIAVRLSEVSVSTGKVLSAHVVTEPLTTSFGQREVDLWLAIALDHAESQVAKGENAGRKLTHTAVVRKITKIGTVKQGQSFAQDIQVKLDFETDTHNLRLIAFVQEAHQGRVFGAALQAVAASSEPKATN